MHDRTVGSEHAGALAVGKHAALFPIQNHQVGLAAVDFTGAMGHPGDQARSADHWIPIHACRVRDQARGEFDRRCRQKADRQKQTHPSQAGMARSEPLYILIAHF
jgi:hypothetical protein